MALELEFIVDTEGLQLDEVLPLSDLLELEILFEETLDFEMVVVEVPSTGIIRHSDTTERDDNNSHPASAIAVDATLFADISLTDSQKIAKAVDDLKASGFTKIVASDTEPILQPVNTIWINTITFNFYILYNDGDSSQWVGFPGNTTGVSSKNYWEGTQLQYDALGTYNDNTLYFITT